ARFPSHSCSAPPAVLPSFPTRRSSDLPAGGSPALTGPRRASRGRNTRTSGVRRGCLVHTPRRCCLRPTARRARSGRGALLAHGRSEEHTSELQSLAYLVCRLLLEKKKQ